MMNRRQIKLLKNLYKILSPSKQGGEYKLREFIQNYINSLNDSNIKTHKDSMGNFFVEKMDSEDEFKREYVPCIVAHLDQVQSFHPSDFKVIIKSNKAYGWSPSLQERCGLGADDKNGIFIALECLRCFRGIKLAFFVQEETGGLGSNYADLSFFKDVAYIIQPDRRGSKDLITNIAETPVCSQEFMEKITSINHYGYEQARGIFTDILNLVERGVGVSCVNLSCGYYSPHTDEEYTLLKDLETCLKYVKRIIREVPDRYEHKIDNYYYDNAYYDSYLQNSDETVGVVVPNLMEKAWELYNKSVMELTDAEWAWVNEIQGGNPCDDYEYY